MTTGTTTPEFGLPFQRATVAGPDDLDLLDRESYDAVVIDGPAIGAGRTTEVLAPTARCLRPGGHLVVVPADHRDASPPPPPPPAELGVRWVGLALLAERPCALLRKDAGLPRRQPDDAEAEAEAEADDSADVPGRLATMARTLDLAEWGQRAGREAALADRADSESALLRHLARLSADLAAEQAARSRLERDHADLQRRFETLDRQHRRLRSSKLGALALRYWQARSGLRRRLRRTSR
ncbi:hypothetical protein [Actinopolymorpha rutila]|uniref:Methyltransferase domain-containing protein n=1 Tax=Actinopolymorpha rutila TaxID=446787 RepID=A0A852ZHH0_9ACTN|nr:hypothetical protein [Actinopolymorpha rutila]NYH89049.1 hypothetical protein [Actinopolymorpha rutila]